jgi:hypothetical protein
MQNFLLSLFGFDGFWVWTNTIIMKTKQPCFALWLSSDYHPRKEYKVFLSYLKDNNQIYKLVDFHSKPPEPLATTSMAAAQPYHVLPPLSYQKGQLL